MGFPALQLQGFGFEDVAGSSVLEGFGCRDLGFKLRDLRISGLGYWDAECLHQRSDFWAQSRGRLDARCPHTELYT